MAEFDTSAPQDIGGTAMAANTFPIEHKELAEWELRMVRYHTSLTFLHTQTRANRQIDMKSSTTALISDNKYPSTP
jgi:hypothetical protein